MLIDDLYCGDLLKNILSDNENMLELEGAVDDITNTNMECSTCPCDNETYLYDLIEDIDPSLFCPDIIMELGDTPIEINNDAPQDECDRNNGSLHPIDDHGVSNKETNDNVHLTLEEHSLRKKLYGTENPVQNTKIHCTSCNAHLGSALSNYEKLCFHPLLQVLVCKDCCDFYKSGEFETDEDGSEKYCRWCGQGGQVICCSSCQFVFCYKCIRRNLGRRELADIRSDDNWKCFKCDWSQLTNLRVYCVEVMDYMERERSNSTNLNQDAMDKDHSRCCGMSRSSTDRARKRKRRSSDDENDLDYNPFEDESCRSASESPIKRTAYTTPNIPLTPRPSVVLPQNTHVRVLPLHQAFNVAERKMPNNTLMSQSNPLLTSPGCCAQSHPPTKQRALQQNPLANFKPIRFTPSITHTQNGTGDKKREVYEKVVSLAGRISADLSSSLTKLSRNKTNATTLEGAVNIHNQFQNVLNNTIDSLMDLRKSLCENRSISTRRIFTVPAQHSSSSVVSSTVKTDNFQRINQNLSLLSNRDQVTSRTAADIDKSRNLRRNIYKNVDRRGTN